MIERGPYRAVRTDHEVWTIDGPGIEALEVLGDKAYAGQIMDAIWAGHKEGQAYARREEKLWKQMNK